MSFTTIELETETNTFTSGESIRGKVIIYKKKREKRVQCIVLKFEGGAIVSIIDHLEETPITSIECCLNTSVCISGEVNATVNGVIIKPGRNEFQFEYLLPRNLPSNFYGKYGSITYSLRAIVVKSRKVYASAKIPLVIRSVFDLNNEPLARKSCELRRENKIWSMCMCHTGTLKLYFSLPKQGFISKEIIPFWVEISNFSFNHMKLVQMSLIQVLFYMIEGKCKKTQTKIVFEQRGPDVPPGKVIIWKGDHGEAFKVPEKLIPTKAGTYSNIQIHYQLQIKIKESNQKSNHDNPVIEAFLPIIIGTIPLEDILVAVTRKSLSPPPSPYEDFDFMDDECTNDEKSEGSLSKSNATSIERFPPAYQEITKEYFI